MIYEIYWSDLTEEAQDRLKTMYHDNIELTPIAEIEIEEEGSDPIGTCKKCNSEVFLSEIEEYDGVCFNCNEYFNKNDYDDYFN